MLNQSMQIALPVYVDSIIQCPYVEPVYVDSIIQCAYVEPIYADNITNHVLT
jgi:hypothetical protein